MKKTYKTITTFIVLLCLLSVQLSAQLSGTVTINFANATGGTNYQTFTAFATALNAQGVSGPLTVNVSSGTYNEQVQFNAITGVSATNTITINGNGATITYNSSNSNAPHVIAMNGSDRMHWNNLIVNGTGTYAYALTLWNTADYNTFSAMTFSVPFNTTTTNHIPVIMSGSGTNYYTYGTNNYNKWQGCTMANGYYGIYMYGTFSAPYPTGNQVLNCTVTDWYQMGISLQYYYSNTLIKGNIVEMPNRTSVTFCYPMYMYYNQGTQVESNRVQRIFNASPTTGSGCYGVYAYWNTAGGGGAAPNNYINNIISDIKGNGQIYAMLMQYNDGKVHHNTISIDNTAATNGGVYALYVYAQSGYEVDVKNNIISVTRGGSSAKYGLYYPSSSITSNYNDVYMGSAGGTSYFGYYSGVNYTSQSAWATGTSLDGNSWSVNPSFTNISANNYIPTNTAINNVGTLVGVFQDIDNLPRSSATPDPGAHEFLSPVCAGSPSANIVVTPTYAICPGNNVFVQLGTYYSDLGITYQWRSSTTSSVGPFVNIPGATTPAYTAPNVTQNTWYSPVITCTNGGGSQTPVGYVMIAGTTTSVVPYLEDFESVPTNHKLPNCSWSASNLGSMSLVYTSAMNQNRIPYSGSKFASFYYTPTGTNSFYSNGIQLNAGVIYSTSVMYTTEYYGYTNWSLALTIGPNQSTVGAVTVANAAVAASPSYKMLSNTFTVATSGIYYLGVLGTSNNSGYAYYLSWDDLRIDIPCQLNAPTVNVTASQTTICSGQSVVLTATGADDYAWDNNAGNTPVVTVSPLFNTNYVATGTHTASGCSATASQYIIVNPTPIINVFSNPATPCAGSQVNITAFGAQTYSWSTGPNGANLVVAPTANASYTVHGSNQYGCVGTAVQQVNVNPLPTITASGPSAICVGETAILTGAGGVTYKWMSNSSFNASNPAHVSPSSSTSYTVEGTDANGCVSTTIHNLGVDACVGLNEASALNGLKVYPNPANLAFVVELNNASVKTIEVLDLTGRIIISGTTSDEKLNVNISNLSNGVYYVKVKSGDAVEVVKIVKQ